ncbi:MAG: hypothetical protein IH920_02540 [Chloroflexi bacterium]|nr:hypothetical protein [Chloroflexota bacterium]
MDETIIVLVSDKDDSKHGEISILDDPQKAERLVETLLEAGFDERRIRVFNGRSSEFQISHRPVVALVDGSSEGTRRPAAEGKSREGKAEEPAADVAVAQSRIQEPPEDEMTEEEEAPATAEIAAPVRFSSLFRSA